MSKFILLDHPLVKYKMSMLRDKNTSNKEFRELIEEIAALVCYEATREVTLIEHEIETPLAKTKGFATAKKFGVVPILRAGIGMTNGILRFIPNAKVGHIGLYRDPKTLKPVEYYCKLPVDCKNSEIFLADPMLATGGTASAAIKFLKDRGVFDIKLLCILVTLQGVEKIKSEHPEVDIYAAACDENLNDHGYIIPGLGDAGDRIFGTK